MGSRRDYVPSGFANDKGLVFLDGIEDSLELHSGVPASLTDVIR